MKTEKGQPNPVPLSTPLSPALRKKLQENARDLDHWAEKKRRVEDVQARKPK